MMYVCSGCGREIEGKDCFPQGPKDKYCRMCNKKFPIFDEYRRKLYEEFDKAKRKEVEAKKLEVFGDKDGSVAREEHYQTHPKSIQLTEEQRMRLDKGMLVSGEKAVDGDANFDPSIQPAVKAIREKIK